MDGLKTSKKKQLEKVSLLQQAHELKKNPNKKVKRDEDQHQKEEEQNKLVEEQNFLAAIQGTLLNTLQEQKNKIQGKQIQSQWFIPQEYRNLSYKKIQKIREKKKIMIEGENVIPCITDFKKYGFPKKVLRILKEKKYRKPTPIQSQCLPIILSGRDLIGIAPSGQGKTLTFILPALLKCIEEEQKMSIMRGEGPFGLIIVPSHELAIQTFDTLQEYSEQLYDQGYPKLKICLNIGGMDARTQMEAGRDGIHLIVGTPGRISDNINKNKFNLDLCQYIVLDEADRLLDLIFEEAISNIFKNIKDNRQTLLFSSTMPKKVTEFAKGTLNRPFVVNIGRSGSVNLNVVQDVKYIKQEDKLLNLLQALQKTGPQVLIFCDKISDVDDIQEYLLIKGIDVASLHGAKTQEDRAKAMREFKQGKKDILVATDLASKGLDFPNIKHVINYDMPPSIESYVHRIGRTGRQGKTGRATTFVNKNQDTVILSDLKFLLIESKQLIPGFMQQIDLSSEITEGCGFCGGLGHKMADCQKLESQKLKALNAQITNSTKDDILKYTKDDEEDEENKQQEDQDIELDQYKNQQDIGPQIP